MPVPIELSSRLNTHSLCFKASWYCCVVYIELIEADVWMHDHVPGSRASGALRLQYVRLLINCSSSINVKPVLARHSGKSSMKSIERLNLGVSGTLSTERG